MWATATERVRLGTNIAYGVGRTPLMWAAEARDLDDLSGGRLILGLGNGTPRMMEDWHGVSGAAPAERMEELVTVLRKLWRLHEGPVDHDGRFYRVHLRPTSDTGPPVQPRLPIWTAGVNNRMIRVAGRVADGLIGHPMFTARYVHEVVRPELAAGLAEAGREPSAVTLMGILMCAVDEDEQAARRRLGTPSPSTPRPASTTGCSRCTDGRRPRTASGRPRGSGTRRRWSRRFPRRRSTRSEWRAGRIIWPNEPRCTPATTTSSPWWCRPGGSSRTRPRRPR